MVDKFNSLAVIPARGGSKRLKRKNLREINGKPLVCYTIEAAIDSECFEKIVLSSDDEEILEIGESYEEITVDRRPDNLSGDTVKAREIVWDIMDKPENKGKYDVISLLLPTALFRKAKDIKAGFDLLSEDLDSVVSLTFYEFPPQLAVKLNEDSVVEPLFEDSGLITGNTRSQDIEKLYRPNGGFYISWWSNFDKNRNFFNGKVKGYVMERIASIDIDEQLDLLYAQFLTSRGMFVLEDGEQ